MPLSFLPRSIGVTFQLDLLDVAGMLSINAITVEKKMDVNNHQKIISPIQKEERFSHTPNGTLLNKIIIKSLLEALESFFAVIADSIT